MASVAVVAACGRMGFDPISDPGPDSAPDSSPPTTGELDPSFGTGGIATLPPGPARAGFALLPRANGGVIVVGVREVAADMVSAELTAWTATGARDSSYGNDGEVVLSLNKSTWAYGARRLPDGRAMIWGDGIQVDTQADDLMYAFLDADDVPEEPLRNIDVQEDDTASSVVPRAAGGLAFCGVANREQADSHYALAFTDAGGTLDASIGSNGILYDDESVGAYDRCWDMELDAQGRLVTAGTGGDDLLLTRHLADGARDPSFGTAGRVRIPALEGEGYEVVFAPDGGVIMVGIDDASAVIARFDADGRPQTSFGDAGVLRYRAPGAGVYDVFYDVLVQPDGSLIVGGVHGRGPDEDGQLLRFDPSGALDTTFGDGGVIRIDRSAADLIYAIAPAPGGGVFATGESNGTTWLIKVR